ncbi:hypothetical protein RCL1_001527 [Eukaryota sp. TZLM3-RCL]
MVNLPAGYNPSHQYNTRLRRLFNASKLMEIMSPRRSPRTLGTSLLEDDPYAPESPSITSSSLSEMQDYQVATGKSRSFSALKIVFVLLGIALLALLALSFAGKSTTTTQLQLTATDSDPPSSCELDVPTLLQLEPATEHAGAPLPEATSKNLPVVYTPTRPNVALLSLGSKIDMKLTSPAYKDNQLSSTASPSRVIDGSSALVPGFNYPLLGTLGRIMVRFPSTVAVSAVQLQHPAFSDLPQYAKSATPRVFSVKCRNGNSETDMGTFEYIDGETNIFPVEECHCSSVGFYFKENYGNPLYTAVYRLKVFGDVI